VPGGGGGGAFRSSTNQNGGAGAAGSLALDYTTPSMGSLIDNFDDNSLDAAKWLNLGGTNVTESGSALNIISGTTSAYFGIVTIGSQVYDLTGTSFISNVSTAGNQAIPTLEVYPNKLTVDASNDLRTMIKVGTVYAQKNVAASVTSLGSVAYNSATMKWFRVRESAGTTYWDYSLNQESWTNIVGTTNPLAVTSLYPQILAGNSATIGTSGTAIIDNVNYLPSTSPTTALNSPADASSGTLTTPTLNFTGTDAEFNGVEYEVQVDTIAPLSTISLEDNFNDNSLDGGKFTTYTLNATVAETNQRIELTPNNSTVDAEAMLLSFNTHDLTGKSVFFQSTVATGTNVQSTFFLRLDASNNIKINKYTDGRLYLSKTVATISSGIADIAYNSTTMAWWRVSESGGNIYVYYSSDGKNWTSWTNFANPFAVTALQLRWSAYELVSDATPGKFIIDNLNIFPATIDALSSTDAGFTAGHPFASGVAKEYTVQSALSLTTYYWRVRAIDPLGSNTWGAWSSTRSFSINDGSSGGVKYWRTLMGVGS
jgi:hypothetical protein